MVEVIKIVSVDTDGITAPLNDGSQGSALYRVPFKLNATPSSVWNYFFIETWNSPPRFTSMHRPGIASVDGDRIVLDGTTVEEVKQCHKETLELCVAEANKRLESYIVTEQQEQQRLESESNRTAETLRKTQEDAKGIRFD